MARSLAGWGNEGQASEAGLSEEADGWGAWAPDHTGLWWLMFY